jgi:hypothetical protein
MQQEGSLISRGSGNFCNYYGHFSECYSYNTH